jgi:hypothetical protein
MMKDAQASGKLWFSDYFGYEPVGEFKDWIYRMKVKKACEKVGLKGKEALAPLLINPSYLGGMIFPRKARRKVKS